MLTHGYLSLGPGAFPFQNREVMVPGGRALWGPDHLARSAPVPVGAINLQKCRRSFSSRQQKWQPIIITEFEEPSEKRAKGLILGWSSFKSGRGNPNGAGGLSQQRCFADGVRVFPGRCRVFPEVCVSWGLPSPTHGHNFRRACSSRAPGGTAS